MERGQEEMMGRQWCQMREMFVLDFVGCEAGSSPFCLGGKGQGKAASKKWLVMWVLEMNRFLQVWEGNQQ